jgi:hypothetical protein
VFTRRPSPAKSALPSEKAARLEALNRPARLQFGR